MNCALLLNCNEMSIYYIRKLLNKRERERDFLILKSLCCILEQLQKRAKCFQYRYIKRSVMVKTVINPRFRILQIKCAHIDRRCLRTGPPRPLPSTHQVPGYMQLTLLSHFYVNQRLFCLENETHFMLRRGVHKLNFSGIFFKLLYCVYMF